MAVHLPGKEAEGHGYLDIAGIIEACRQNDVQAVLPGYGFLSENDEFARQLDQASILLCGPRAETMQAFGLKHEARQLAQRASVPCVPGTGLIHSAAEAQAAATSIGYPVMLKSSAGGGGMGLQICRNVNDLVDGYNTVTSRSQALFGSSAVFMEKFVEKGHHVEIQIFGNGMGDCISFHERECSIQRRNQKVIEEAPSPFVAKTPGLRDQLTQAACSLGKLVKYRSAGTVEMLVDDDTTNYYFLECNVRLQVEHPVTEMTHDIDLVALMLWQAEMDLAGKGGISSSDLASMVHEPEGWAIEARLYAENPVLNYAPSPGILQYIDFRPVPGTRVDGWVKTGTTVSSSYDPLLAKLIGSGQNREEARNSLQQLITTSKVMGPATNLELLEQILSDEKYSSGETLTSFLTSSTFAYRPIVVEVQSPGLGTNVQAYPGRRGVLHGIPEAGPLDNLSLRIANLLVGNSETTEGLEITMTGPTLHFHASAIVALVGAEMIMDLDGETAPTWTRLLVKAGSILSIGSIIPNAAGMRAYLSFRGGLPNVAEWIGSKASSPAIGVGGFQGRNLLQGDTLALANVDLGSTHVLTIPKAFRWTQAMERGHWEL